MFLPTWYFLYYFCSHHQTSVGGYSRLTCASSGVLAAIFCFLVSHQRFTTVPVVHFSCINSILYTSRRDLSLLPCRQRALLCICVCVNVCCSFSKYLQLLTNFASDCRLLKSIHYCVFSNFMHILHVYLHTYGILNIWLCIIYLHIRKQYFRVIPWTL